MSFLTLSQITKKVENSFILKDVTFSQQKFKKIAVAGETGSGKSMLLKIIAGLVQPDEGTVIFENERVSGPEEKLIPGHARIAYLSQHFELRNNYRVEEILEMANKMPDDEARNIFDVCRISHLLKRRTDHLSGGEKQRIATARLLIAKPKLLLLDEPFSNLDVVHKTILKAVINDIGEKLGITCLMVLHDPLDTLSWADEILVLKNGQIVQQGAPPQIYTQPVSEYVAGLFGKYNLISQAQMQAFKPFVINKNNGKSIFVRPENFKINTKQNDGILVKVNKVNFFGSYYETEVLLAENIIIVKTAENGLRSDNTVYLHLPAENLWYL